MFSSSKKKPYFFKKTKLNRQKEIEPHEIILDSLAQKKEAEMGLSEKRFEVPLSKKILQGIWIGFLILTAIFFIRTFQMTILEREKYFLLAQENRLRTYLVRPERGVIYDKDMNQLVWNHSSFDLVFDKRDFPPDYEDRLRILKRVADITGKDLNEIKKTIDESSGSRAWILENIPHETLIVLEAAIKEIPGFHIEKNTIREYKEGSIYAHTIGFMGKINEEEFKSLEDYSISDYIGKSGLEKYYEKMLRGIPGKMRVESDAFGNKKSEEIASVPESGKSLILYLDSELQKKITSEIEKMLESTGAKKGVGIALDPNTGGVLALVSVPAFDNNPFSKGISSEELEKLLKDSFDPLFNRVIAGEYLTGSTIKPLIAAAALQEKIISPEKKIYDDGAIEIVDQYNPEIIWTYRDWAPHGWVDLRKALAVSCNVYFYTIGGGYENQRGLGAERIKKYLNLFGWGEKTGIDLPGETKGFIPDPGWKLEKFKEPWTVGNTYHFSIGQGYLRITPLQVAASFVTVANGGKLLQPQMVQRIIDNSTGKQIIIWESQPKIIRENFIETKNLQIVREGMREAVTYGSSVILNTLPVKAAAKTGTAETSKPDHYNNWITVFAPYENPEIVLTILIEDVKNLQVAALPVAKEILNWYFSEAK